jgi:hypothetical protein
VIFHCQNLHESLYPTSTTHHRPSPPPPPFTTTTHLHRQPSPTFTAHHPPPPPPLTSGHFISCYSCSCPTNYSQTFKNSAGIRISDSCLANPRYQRTVAMCLQHPTVLRQFIFQQFSSVPQFIFFFSLWYHLTSRNDAIYVQIMIFHDCQ